MMEASKVRNEATLKEELMLVYWNMIQVFGYSVQNHPENTKLFWNTETRRPPRQQSLFPVFKQKQNQNPDQSNLADDLDEDEKKFLRNGAVLRV
jgi:hypothetical protein